MCPTVHPTYEQAQAQIQAQPNHPAVPALARFVRAWEDYQAEVARCAKTRRAHTPSTSS